MIKLAPKGWHSIDIVRSGFRRLFEAGYLREA